VGTDRAPSAPFVLEQNALILGVQMHCTTAPALAGGYGPLQAAVQLHSQSGSDNVYQRLGSRALLDCMNNPEHGPCAHRAIATREPVRQYEEGTHFFLHDEEKPIVNAAIGEHPTAAVFWLRLRPQTGFHFVNDAMAAMTGYGPEEFCADPDLRFRIVHPADLPLLHGVMSGWSAACQTVVRWVHRDGGIRWIEQRMSVVAEVGGDPTDILCVALDITDRITATLGCERGGVQPRMSTSQVAPHPPRDQSAPRHTAHTTLPSSPNRAVAIDRLHQAVAAGTPGNRVTLALCEVDNLSLINQTCGPETGDAVMAEILARIADVAVGGTVAQIGGGTVAILFAGPSSDRRANRLATDLSAAADQRFNAGGRRLASSLRFGSATNTGEADIYGLLAAAMAELHDVATSTGDGLVGHVEATDRPRSGATGSRMAAA
jgi:PAS domain S-box-containing protein